jgi:hypothetical protein
MVATNTVRQNYSREGSLDYITANGGTITEAVGTQVWSGDAAVHVSVVNWVKAPSRGKKSLYWQNGDAKDSPWDRVQVDTIGPSLSPRLDVTTAVPLAANSTSGCCYQGQTHGHEAFLLEEGEARGFVRDDARNRDVLYPYIIGDDLLGRPDRGPRRWAIDFAPLDLHSASKYVRPFAHLKKLVLPDREAAASEEEKRNQDALADNPRAKVNRHHRQFLERWWQFSWPRGELIHRLSTIGRYVACARVTKRPIFEFVSTRIRPNDALQVFPLDDDYSFGVLQSSIHWQWFVERCSTLTGRYRYTSDTVFAWPQNASVDDVSGVAEAAKALRATRDRLLSDGSTTLRSLYRLLDTPGKSELRDAHEALDDAVRAAYGMSKKTNPLAFLLEQNRELAVAEQAGRTVLGPGIPPAARALPNLVSENCVAPPRL